MDPAQEFVDGHVMVAPGDIGVQAEPRARNRSRATRPCGSAARRPSAPPGIGPVGHHWCFGDRVAGRAAQRAVSTTTLRSS
jgi:hypothetical protein